MFNFFQKKNKSNRPDSVRGSKVKNQNVKSESVLLQKKEDEIPSKKNTNTPINMIPHISEKASNLISQNSYVFKVAKDFNKISAKKAIESHYGVKIDSLNVLNTKPKKRVRGNIVGKKSGYKKVIIQLKEGFKIEL